MPCLRVALARGTNFEGLALGGQDMRRRNRQGEIDVPKFVARVQLRDNLLVSRECALACQSQGEDGEICHAQHTECKHRRCHDRQAFQRGHNSR
jgi:hypothetical protein